MNEIFVYFGEFPWNVMCWYEDFLYIGRTTESTRNHVIFLRNLFKYVFVFVLIFLLESIEIDRFFTRHEQIWIIFLTMTTSIGAKSQEIEHQKKKTKTLHQQYIVRCKMRINWRICFCLNFSLRKEKLRSLSCDDLFWWMKCCLSYYK